MGALFLTVTQAGSLCARVQLLAREEIKDEGVLFLNLDTVRLLRLLRLLKLVNSIEKLHVLVHGLSAGVESISFVALLLVIIFYLFAIGK